MRIFKSNFYSLLVTFVVFSVSANAQKGPLNCEDFNIRMSVAEYFRPKDTNQAYLELKDGSKIYSDTITTKLGRKVKDQIKAGDKIFKMKDTRGYYAGGNYYGFYSMYGNIYVKRFIQGKINLYFSEHNGNFPTTDSKGHTREYYSAFCNHYYQIGDSTELVMFQTFEDIKKLVKDCPKSLAMINKDIKEIRQAIKENPAYLNEVFTVYNNGCK